MDPLDRTERSIGILFERAEAPLKDRTPFAVSDADRVPRNDDTVEGASNHRRAQERIFLLSKETLRVIEREGASLTERDRETRASGALTVGEVKGFSIEWDPQLDFQSLKINCDEFPFTPARHPEEFSPNCDRARSGDRDPAEELWGLTT